MLGKVSSISTLLVPLGMLLAAAALGNDVNQSNQLSTELLRSDGVAFARCASARTSTDNASKTQPEITAAIDPTRKNWVQDQVSQARSVLLTNSYLFQVMKGAAQENQKATEEEVIIPLLKQTLEGLVKASAHPDARRLFSVALILLSDDTSVGRDEDTTRQAEIIKQNELFNPRGHYTDSEALQKYFRSMQYLAKATVDVSIAPNLFPYPKEMLFPFETADSVRRLFSDPANRHLFRMWNLIHDFYSDVNGPPDYPTFADLESIAMGKHLTVEVAKKWAMARGIPKINPERGLGIQPLGERTSLHQVVIDEVKAKFIKVDTAREEIAQILKFENLLGGVTREDGSVKGMAERVSSEKGRGYYVSALNAVALGADGWRSNRMRLNFFAASMTSLAEQTAMMAKTSILVRKSAQVQKKIPENLKLHLEPGSHKYLVALAKSSTGIAQICRKTSEEAGTEPAKDLRLVDMGPLFISLAKRARNHQTLLTRGRVWEAHGASLMELLRKPAVTVDVFHVKDRDGKMNYYQWAIAPFEIDYSSAKSRTKTTTKGMEMVFFEAWADEMVSGHEGPLNNLVWESRIHEGNLGALHSLVSVPK